MNNNYTKILFTAILLSLPILSSAQLTKTKGLLQALGGIVVNILIPLAFSAGLVFFFWGVAKYIRSAGTEKDEGKKIMVWGVVALFVMASVWGLVAFLQGELLGADIKTDMPIPTIGGTGTGGGSPGPCPYGQSDMSGNCVSN